MNEELASDYAGLRKPEQPFPLELVASIAVRVLLAHKDFEKQPPYEEAVDIAVRLLQACQSRLKKDEPAQAKDQLTEDWREDLRQSHAEYLRLEQKYGDPVPFLKGLLYVTQKRSEKEALPHYTRWLLYHTSFVYAEAESRQFFGQPKPPPQPTQANLDLELQRQRRDGFDPATLAYYRKSFSKWHVEIDLPDRKRRPKEKPG